jgi:hypothetical protein
MPIATETDKHTADGSHSHSPCISRPPASAISDKAATTRQNCCTRFIRLNYRGQVFNGIGRTGHYRHYFIRFGKRIDHPRHRGLRKQYYINLF